MKQFVHLHVHTQHSLLDGLCDNVELARAVAASGQPAVASTDHGSLSSLVAHTKACLDAGVKPILGQEIYTTSPGRRYGHLTVLAETPEGLSNLLQLTAMAADNIYYRPRVDLQWLESHGKGLLATTGCPSGETQYLLRTKGYDAARSYTASLNDALGGNLYVEVMSHDNDIEKETIEDLYRLSKDLGIPLVATNDVHYVKEEDAEAHDLLLCCNTNSLQSNPNRFKFDGTGYHLRTREEMERLFNAPELDITLEIAERCNAQPILHEGLWMPVVPDAIRVLRERIEVALRDKPEVKSEQAWYEYDIIVSKGYADYFLFCADSKKMGEDAGILFGPGRGSGGGSSVAYLLNITHFNPAEYGCIFERFLNPERDSLPDFDIDIQSDRRKEFIKMLFDHYGHEYSAYVGAFSTLKPKGALERVSKALGVPEVGLALKKVLPPPVAGREPPLNVVHDEDHKQYSQAGPMRDMLETLEGADQVHKTASKLEGVLSHSTTHAGGIVFSPIRLDCIAPMARAKDGLPQIQLSGPEVEALGLVKFDYLSLNTLAILAGALNYLGEEEQKHARAHVWTGKDPKVYDLFKQVNGPTSIFQVSANGISGLTHAIKPESIGELSDVLGLYRPGPLEADADKTYLAFDPTNPGNVFIHHELHPKLEQILMSTNGVIVYQEQIMEIVQVVSGFSLAEADIIRRAMGKKKPEILQAQYEKIKSGGMANGYSEEAMQTLWDILLPFSDYGFNRSHSVAYAFIAYATAYMRVYHPTEWWASVLKFENDAAQLSRWVTAAREDGIQVLGPSVEHPSETWTVASKGVIRCGLGHIKGMPSKDIARLRPANTYERFLELNASRVSPSILRLLERVGALPEDAGLYSPLATADRDLKRALKLIALHCNKAPGLPFDNQTQSLDPDLIPVAITSENVEMLGEAELLGTWVSHHPMRDLGLPSGTLDKRETGVAAVLAIEEKISKAGNRYHRYTLSNPAVSNTIMYFGPPVDLHVGDVVDYTVQVQGDFVTLKELEKRI